MRAPPRVLLIDGSAALATRLRAELHPSVLDAASFAEVRDVLTHRPADLALTHLGLLGRDVAPTVAAVKRAHDVVDAVPIIALAERHDDAQAAAALRAGAQDFVALDDSANRLTRAIAFAVERSRAEASRAERRANLLSEVSLILGSAGDCEENLAAMARLLVPWLADACTIDVIEDGGATRCIGSARDYGVRLPSGGDGGELRDATSLVVPLLIGGRGRGATRPRIYATMTLERADGTPRFGGNDVALAAEIAHRAALATENALLCRSREEMLTIVSHDLRNPLSVVSLSVATMRRTSDSSGDLKPRLDPVEKIRRAAEQMSGLIADMIDMSRIESGHLPVECAPQPTLPLLGEVFEAMRPLADDKRLKLVTEVTGVLPPISVDRDRVLQVLKSLIGEAIQFTPAPGVVTIGAQVSGDSVKLWVKDGAPEIAREERARLFERCWRAKRPGQRGSGLTLPVARGIVEAHGGRIWTTSNAGAGSTFYVTFPIA